MASEPVRRLMRARRLEREGRPRAAAEAFRAAAGMWTRRGRHQRAARVDLELGAMQLRRGAVEAARQSFERSARLAMPGSPGTAGRARVGEAVAAWEAGRTGEAAQLLDRCLEGEDGRRRVFALWVRTWWMRLCVRCGEAAPAAAYIDGVRGVVGGVQCARDILAQWYASAAEVMLELRGLDAGFALTETALGLVTDGGAEARWATHLMAVRVRGVLGDVDAVRRHATLALMAARQVRASLQAEEVRLALLTASRRMGKIATARTLARRLAARVPRLPARLRADVGLEVARVIPGGRRSRGPGRRPSARVSVAPSWIRWRGLVDEALQLVADEADDGAPGRLERLAHRLRRSLQASGITIESRAGACVTTGRPLPGTLARGMAQGQADGSTAPGGDVLVTVPVRFQGELVGAIRGVWGPGGPESVEQARVLMASAAAVAGAAVTADPSPAEPLPAGSGEQELIGQSAAAVALRGRIQQVAAAPFPVLVLGESGVGKELVARALHRGSPRAGRGFEAVNCAALVDELADAELFGHVRGAFTGAVTDRPGVFERSDGGTLFLDEVAELAPRAQAKLLRVVQDGQLRRVGDGITRQVDVRIVAATHRRLDDPAQADACGFRGDLRYRLDVIRLVVPPLRERVDDIPLLAQRFWEDCARRTGSHARLGAGVVAALARYPWPGNVRQLQNVIAALATYAPRWGTVPAAALPPEILAGTETPLLRLDEARYEFERRFVASVCAQTGWQRRQAADVLGVSRQGLTKLLRRLRLTGVDGRQAALAVRRIVRAPTAHAG